MYQPRYDTIVECYVPGIANKIFVAHRLVAIRPSTELVVELILIQETAAGCGGLVIVILRHLL